ncbi:putative glyoxalase superfamily protein PhnB [Pseudomonas duriflava]|uniref:Putative glyoxalase superfamily protein PhnB n=1 Tax=Pseudomonas duriflava TaxID=459528 RepID=A0A562Q9E8_9PSED|nr:VOC family protein [Pseudomonas duriflava]TWI53339.1 putative glyoxalase superfamily protein PhnB [Pseudomonas duriflava]
MIALPSNTQGFIIPYVRYHDAPAAIDWLRVVFGFEVQEVITNDDGSIAYARLGYGQGLVIIASVLDKDIDAHMIQPGQAGGVTQALYLVTSDPDTLCQRARTSGADIVIDIQDSLSEGRTFTCRDREGHLWHFSTHDLRQPFPANTKGNGHSTEGYAS